MSWISSKTAFIVVVLSPLLVYLLVKISYIIEDELDKYYFELAKLVGVEINLNPSDSDKWMKIKKYFKNHPKEKLKAKNLYKAWREPVSVNESVLYQIFAPFAVYRKPNERSKQYIWYVNKGLEKDYIVNHLAEIKKIPIDYAQALFTTLYDRGLIGKYKNNEGYLWIIAPNEHNILYFDLWMKINREKYGILPKLKVLHFFSPSNVSRDEFARLANDPPSVQVEHINLNEREDLVEKYNIRCWPTLVLIDEQGNSIKEFRGQVSGSMINNYIDKIIINGCID